MLTIRLARVGKKNKAQYKIVLQEKTIAPGGRHVEILGSYDPHVKQIVIKEDRIKYWIEKGAQPSDTAYNLFISKGIIKGEKRKVKLPAKAEPETPATPAPAGEVKAETKPEETKVEKPEAKEETPKEEEKK